MKDRHPNPGFLTLLAIVWIASAVFFYVRIHPRTHKDPVSSRIGTLERIDNELETRALKF